MDININPEINDLEALEEQPKEEASKWLDRIDQASKFEEQWRRKAREYEQVYKCKPIQSDSIVTYGSVAGGEKIDARRMVRRPQSNIFYSNVQFLRSCALTKMPEIVVRSRYPKTETVDKERKQQFTIITDVVQRVLTELVNTTENYEQVQLWKDDVLIDGRGVLWVIFDEEQQRIYLQRIGMYDFRISPARNWGEVSWIARRILMSKDDLESVYDEDIIDSVNMGFPSEEDVKTVPAGQIDKIEKMAEIWEIWDKNKRRVLHVTKGVKDVLDSEDDPYGLEGFFPTPEPLLAISTRDTMVPTPEFDIYRGDAYDIGNYNRRQAILADGIKGVTAIPKDIIKDTLNLKNARDNDIVILDGSALTNAMSNGRSIGDFFQSEPLENKAQVMDALDARIDRKKGDIYEATGISDAMQITNSLQSSGGDAETATRTIMKGKFGSIRLQDRQKLYNTYIKKIYNICADIVCSSVSAETMQEVSEIVLDGTTTQLTWDNVIQFLRDQRMQKLLLDIETDMNVWESDAEEQASAESFVETYMEQLQKNIEIIKNNPEQADVILALWIYALNRRHIPSGERNLLEDVLRTAAEQAKQAAQEAQDNPDEGQQDPQMILAQAEQTKAENMGQEIQVKAQMQQAELELRKQELEVRASEAASKQQSAQVNAQTKAGDNELAAEKMRLDYEIAMTDLAIKKQELDLEAQNLDEDGQLEVQKLLLKTEQEEEKIKADYETKMAKLKIQDDTSDVDAAVKVNELEQKEKANEPAVTVIGAV